MRVHVDMMLVVRRVPVNTRPSVCTVARDTVMILMLQSNHLWFHSILVCFPRLHRHWQTSRHLLVSIHRMDRKRLQYQQAINLHHPVRWYCRQPASVTLRHLGINTRSSAGIETLCGWSWSISTGKEAVTSSVLTYLLYYITTRVAPSSESSRCIHAFTFITSVVNQYKPYIIKLDVLTNLTNLTN